MPYESSICLGLPDCMNCTVKEENCKDTYYTKHANVVSQQSVFY